MFDVHPTLDHTATTIISDQEKGLKSALMVFFAEAMPCRCALHRAKKVFEKCRSNQQLAKSFYLRLVNAPTMEQFKDIKQKLDKSELSEADKDYVMRIDASFVETDGGLCGDAGDVGYHE